MKTLLIIAIFSLMNISAFAGACNPCKGKPSGYKVCEAYGSGYYYSICQNGKVTKPVYWTNALPAGCSVVPSLCLPGWAPTQ